MVQLFWEALLSEDLQFLPDRVFFRVGERFFDIGQLIDYLPFPVLQIE